jgi:ubiquinol-cytochrome c reductase cytochrome b subunit
MLRAVTSDFAMVLTVLAVLAAAAIFVRGRFNFKLKLAITVVLLILAVLLQVFDAKFFGVVMMGGAVVILFFLPWLDHSPVRSIRYRPGWHKALYAVFMINFLILGYLGTQAPNDVFNLMSQIGTLIYLAFFLLMPIWSRLGTFKPVPDRVTFAAH